jgi:NAD-dependent dihydropyrimidine dehydrogenase PreA subunit
MPYVIVEPCIGSKDASCVEACPVDYIHPTPGEPGFEEAEHLFIDPGESVECNVCARVCPVEACLADSDVPVDRERYIADNTRYFNAPA